MDAIAAFVGRRRSVFVDSLSKPSLGQGLGNDPKCSNLLNVLNFGLAAITNFRRVNKDPDFLGRGRRLR